MKTETYKQLLLKFITGKMEESEVVPQSIVRLDREVINTNIKDDITSLLEEQKNAISVNIVGKIYNNQYENFIIYGNYNTSSNQYGYICLVNSNLEIISLLTQFASGTLIYPLISVRQSETGQFYGLTYGTNGNDADYRIALFNNILTSGLLNNNYEVILRQTYIVPNSASYRGALFRQNRIIKSLDSSTYYIVLHNTNNVTVIIKFVIDIASGNTWEVYQTSYLMDTVQFDVLLDKSSGTETFYFYGIDVLSSPNVYRAYKLEDNLTQLNSIALSGEVTTFLSQVFVLNKDNIYISVGNSTNHNTILYKVNNSTLNSIYSFNWASTLQSYLYLEKFNEEIFYKKKNTNTSSATIETGLLINDTLQSYGSETTADTENSNYDYNDFYIFIQYNLVRIYIPYKASTNGTYILIADYNINNYNGTEYENTNSLLPNKCRIKNSDLRYIFARNLYNKYVRNNTTVSTIEIPNTLLNDENISNIDLLGYTNYSLFTDVVSDNPITKNIYEILDINFYNTINMKDMNTIQTIDNQIGATKINESTSAIVDYHNSQATKARLNFDDGTYSITTINPATQITISESGDSADYNFVVYIPSDKTATNLEIISYDETTVYATIPISYWDVAPGTNNQVVQGITIL